MKHRCKCWPNQTHTWSNSELQAALEYHEDGVLRLGPRRFDIVSQRIPCTTTHHVRFKEVT